MTTPLSQVGRLPVAQDNCAIAIRNLPAGTSISDGEHEFTLSHTILEGHRFAVRPIAIGESLLSWGQTFGFAIHPISAGDYVINEGVLIELGRRTLDFDLPAQANFQNELAPYQFDAATFQPATPLPRFDEMRTFEGYRRADGRGVGTRNVIVLLGTTSLSSGFVRKLESRLQIHVPNYANIDGIVAIAHTEGGHQQPNNRDLLMRTLAGWMVHPNVGAVLAVDYGYEAITNVQVETYLAENGYSLDGLPHQFMSIVRSFDEELNNAEAIVTGWLDTVNQLQRSDEPLSELKIALQCGGSDAFSGISGNPLSGWVAKQVIQYGGSANLAETDELIGAENYVLSKVRSAATIEKFLSFVERFKERVAWHGHSAEGNPSGGNKYRGLYNIYLKSLGAATKRDPEVPLDFVIDYGELMKESGFYFMDSPGNDLESIAGQVASGCNMIFFITGNGSITNFPFVPTIKVVTTTQRYQLLSKDMDVNAGLYLDGMPLEELGAQMLDLTVNVASGQLSVGEKAGHSQVQIWRDWIQTKPANIVQIKSVHYSGKPIAISADVDSPDVTLPVYQTENGTSTDRVALILPTSLCSGQIARMCVDYLNKNRIGQDKGLSRFVTLVHTEGCGGSVNDEFSDTLLGYLSHPYVKHALLLEHGCESTHNAFFRQMMTARGYDLEDYGWASVQLDGGIQNVIHKMADWFNAQLDASPQSEQHMAGLEAVKIAIVTQGKPSDALAENIAELTKMIVGAGGSVVVNEQDSLLRSEFADSLDLVKDLFPSLDYGQGIKESGFHVMAAPTHDWGEILTGLGATGVELIVSFIQDHAMPGHPMIPVLQVTDNATLAAQLTDDVDILLNPVEASSQLLSGIIATLSHEYTPKLTSSGNVYFQITRGLLGVSL